MKYNIAISGTFNVENYGDLMFPVIFKKAMEKRGLDFELFLFSPEKSCPKALDDSTMVYAIEEIDKIHRDHPLDAVVVGGGALVHYNEIAVKFPGDDDIVGYDITESWLHPIEFATRNNVKILFNLPQVPFPFAEPFRATTRAAFDCCDYISFRDNISKKYLIDAYSDNNSPIIDVYPDSVCCISKLIDATELEQIRKNLLSFDDKYAVIQFNPQKPVEDDKYLVQIIEKIKNQGHKIVLLPIGYTHNDDQILQRFNTEHNLDCEIIAKKLNIIETAAVLAGGEIYFGSSFHGAITAIAYGKKAISYNYIYPKNKNKEIFKMYGISDFVVNDAEEALNLLNDLYDNKITFNPQTNIVLAQLNEYFDNLYTMIISGKKNSCDYEKLVLSSIKALPKLAKLDLENKQLISNLDSQKDYSIKLEKIVQQHIDEVNRCSKYISDLENHNKNLENQNKDLEKNNLEQNNYIKSLEITLADTAKQLNEVQNAYSRIRNNFFIRCIYFAKNLIKKKS